jgi:hypothetical protein
MLAVPLPVIAKGRAKVSNKRVTLQCYFPVSYFETSSLLLLTNNPLYSSTKIQSLDTTFVTSTQFSTPQVSLNSNMPPGGTVTRNIDIARAGGDGEFEIIIDSRRIAGRVAGGQGVRIENFNDGRQNQTWVSRQLIGVVGGWGRERRGRRLRRDEYDEYGENYGGRHVRHRDGRGPLNYGGGRDHGYAGRHGQDLRDNHYFDDDDDSGSESVDLEALYPHCGGIRDESPSPANEGRQVGGRQRGGGRDNIVSYGLDMDNAFA